jgi:hypothetical protein
VSPGTLDLKNLTRQNIQGFGTSDFVLYSLEIHVGIHTINDMCKLRDPKKQTNQHVSLNNPRNQLALDLGFHFYQQVDI